jgi:ABC-type nitrate/sulfonate/bicarbonate transport system ATPase subunit
MSGLQLNGVSKTFRTKHKQIDVLDNLSLSIQEGEFVALIGPSGSGKSTLFQIIGGLVSADRGEVKLDGSISYVPQHNSLFPWRTVVDNILLPSELSRKESASMNRAKAHLLLDKLGLGDYAYAYPSQLSGGMQQRIAFARALMSDSSLMLLDEPFGALDALTRMAMQNWLLDLWQAEQRTVFMITHSIEEALLLADRIYILSDKPARVLKEIVVPFERPRDQSIRTRPEFQAYASEIYTLLMK